MRDELARLVPTDATYYGRGRHLAVLLFALPLLAVPLNVIAYRGLVPFAVVLALIDHYPLELSPPLCRRPMSSEKNRPFPRNLHFEVQKMAIRNQ